MTEYANIGLFNDSNIARAAHHLKAGDLVAFATETVYGLGADCTNPRAVEKIYSAKGRPSFNPLIVHIADLDMAQKFAKFDQHALVVADHFWPGPLTLVLPKQIDCPACEAVTAGLPTIALRVPGHEGAQQLLKVANVGIAAPSANISGHISPTIAHHVAADLGDVPAIILDGGAADKGLESTILKITPNEMKILRPGSISGKDISACFGVQISEFSHVGKTSESQLQGPEIIEAPGTMLRHYAPKTVLRLNASHVGLDEALISFGQPLRSAGPVFQLSESGSLIEAAHNLYAALRAMDEAGMRQIAVMPIPQEGVGCAINDRLKRASAGQQQDDKETI